MLSSDQMIVIATAYALEYHNGNGIKAGEPLSEPAGMLFHVDRVGLVFGDAGFFVSAIDGRIIQLRSGSFMRLRGVNIGTESGMKEAVRRLLVEALRSPLPAPDRHGLRVD